MKRKKFGEKTETCIALLQFIINKLRFFILANLLSKFLDNKSASELVEVWEGMSIADLCKILNVLTPLLK